MKNTDHDENGDQGKKADPGEEQRAAKQGKTVDRRFLPQYYFGDT